MGISSMCLLGNSNSNNIIATIKADAKSTDAAARKCRLKVEGCQDRMGYVDIATATDDAKADFTIAGILMVFTITSADNSTVGLDSIKAMIKAKIHWQLCYYY